MDTGLDDTTEGSGTSVISASGRRYVLPPDEQRCTATKANGERCKGRRAGGYEKCAGHQGLGFSRSPEAARAAQQRSAQSRQELRHQARLMAVMSPRELMLTQMTQRVEDGQVAAAVDRGLASADERTALQAASLVLDRAFGRPVAVTETQLPGTQAYVELRTTLASLPAEDRLAYLREARMTADVASSPATHALARAREEEDVIDVPTGPGQAA